MTDEEDASRLRTRADVPPEMLRALRALKTEGPSRSSLDHVAARLGNLLDAPAPAASSVGWLLRSVGARAVVLRVGMAVLAIGATAAWLRPSASERDAARTPAGVEASADQPIAADDSAHAAAELRSREEAAGASTGRRTSTSGNQTADAAGAASASASTTNGEPGHAQHDGSGGRGHRTRARPVRSSQARAATARFDVRSPGATALSERADLAEAPSTDLDKAGSLLAEQRAEAAGHKPDAAVPQAAESPTEPASVRKLSEVELLLEARRLSVREPKAAQQVLDQHAVRFPDGVLAPEREVLAIEVLKALGQTAAAEQRLRAFRARYPNSIHLRRLSSPPANPKR